MAPIVMDEHQKPNPRAEMEARVNEMHLTNATAFHEVSRTARAEGLRVEMNGALTSPGKARTNPSTPSPIKSEEKSQSPQMMKDEHQEVGGANAAVKLEPTHPPKLARMASQKIPAKPAVLFDAYANKTEESKSTFRVIGACIYSSKQIGSTEQAMECDCAEEWDGFLKANMACGEDSDCINRATKMECVGDCGCGPDCKNQRFQQQQYANVAVIQTEKKGFGLRAESDLHANDFIFEYIGEVINEAHFRRRMIQYDEEGIKHFYFMSLSKGEFVDATKKGNLGRFCNHSCNPNCYVDKWVVGDKLRMGIFAERNIKAGEELVFNYNVDRYGADPQPCYCAEPNCTGYIGGKTQTERATKLSNTTIEALGIDDGDGWDTAVAKKPRKKKIGEDDEEYVNNVQPKSLDEDGVTKVMATLLQCKEKWIAVKLLSRIQRCDDERVRNRVVKMHGYQILNSALALWKEDFNVVLQILNILNQFPRLTRNKISDSKIESTVESLKGCGDERVEAQSIALLNEWSTLEVAYRIPRKKRDANNPAVSDKPDHFGRREPGREERKGRSRSPSANNSRSRSRSLDAPRGPAAPTGPRAGAGQRHNSFYPGPRPPYRPRPFNSLPPGWFAATSNGSTYYYSAAGQTTWTRPTIAAAQPPPPPKPGSANKVLEDIINEITNAKAKTPVDKAASSTAPQLLAGDLKTDKKNDGKNWAAYSEEKQKKIYENTLYPHVRYVMNKFKAKLPRDDLKRFAKEISKKLVNSDFKNKRVGDPRQISSRQEQQVKKHVKDYFDKAVVKKRVYEQKKAERPDKAADAPDLHKAEEGLEVKKERESDEELDIELSDDEAERAKQDSGTPITPLDQPINGDALKRKRESPDAPGSDKTEDEFGTPSKRLRSETPPPPPPPPPPPADCGFVDQGTASDQPMTDDTLKNSHSNLANTSKRKANRNFMNGTPRAEASPASEVDLLSPDLAFKLTRPFVDLAETSDSARSSTIFDASNMTPIESDGDGVEKAEQSYGGLNLLAVQKLEMQDSR